MKNLLFKIFAGLLFVMAGSPTFAETEIPIENEAMIAGTWDEQGTARKLDGSMRSSKGVVWVIKGGKIEMQGLYDPQTDKNYNTEPVDFKIEKGKLYMALLGRPGKFKSFTLVEKTDNSMVLKGLSEGYIFLQKK